MHGEYPSSYNPKDDNPEIEVRDNVVPLYSKEKPVEHVIEHIMGETGTHKRSLYILSELGYSNLEEAKKGLEDLRNEKDGILKDLNKYMMLSALGKLRDKVFNHGKQISKLAEVEASIHKLVSAIRFTKATKYMGKTEVPGEVAEESSKAA